jgi:hypothetical protein
MIRAIQDNKTKFIVAAIVVAALSRLLPHPYNFTPIGAMALFGGTYIKDKRQALLLPMAAMLLSDLLLQLFVFGNGFHAGMAWVYGSFAIITTLGFYLRKRVQRQTIMVASLVGSLIFFFVTNFGVWISSGMYPLNSSGLVTCYIQAIPFFGGTIMGDLSYNLILFGTYALVKWRYPVLVKEG